MKVLRENIAQKIYRSWCVSLSLSSGYRYLFRCAAWSIVRVKTSKTFSERDKHPPWNQLFSRT